MRVSTLFLPGDRELYELAKIVSRDNRPTYAEIEVARAAYYCAYQKSYSYRWCPPGEPCYYCQRIRRFCE